MILVYSHNINCRAMFRFRLPKIYLEIDKSYILIGVLKEKKGTLYCEIYEQQKLSSLEVRQGELYNLSAISSFIERTLDKYHFKGAKAVVCCPYFAGCSALKKQLASLQVSLCVCKAGLRIDALYDERILLR